MALSYVRYTGDGSTTQYAISFTLGYLSEDDIYCYVDDVEVGFSFITEGLIELTVPASIGSSILIRRIVNKEALIHNYTDGAVVVEQNLDDSNKQALMASHEVTDGFLAPDGGFNTDVSMNGKRLTDVGDPIDAQDVVTKNYVDNGLPGYVTAAEAAQLSAENAATDSESFALDAANSASDASSFSAASSQSASEAATSASEAATSASEAIDTLGKVSNISNTSTIVDLHYGICKGVGFLSTETGSERVYDVQLAATAGDYSIQMSSIGDVSFGQPLVQGQLIVYLGNSGNYYTTVISSISGSLLTLATPLEDNVASGNFVFNFYTNESHPTTKGFKAIADFALLDITPSGSLISKQTLTAFGGASVVTNSTNTAGNPGSSTVQALSVTAAVGGIGEGVSCTFDPPESGAYEINVRINPGGNLVKVLYNADGLGKSTTVSGNCVQTVRLFMGVASTTSIFISVTVDTAATFDVIEEIDIFKLRDNKSTLDGGTHVLLGDSWFDMATDGIFDRLVDQLPLATIYEEGVGGNTAAQSVARFTTDVLPHNPDFVWYITGTNDYYSSVTPTTLSFYVNLLKALCAANGIHLILLTSSVGSQDLSAARFDLSRRYIDECLYSDEEFEITAGGGSGSEIGAGQAWTNLTASRALSTVYTNTTGKSIVVNVGFENTNPAGGLFIQVDGIDVDYFYISTTSYKAGTVSAIVPDGSTYECISLSSIPNILMWVELR